MVPSVTDPIDLNRVLLRRGRHRPLKYGDALDALFCGKRIQIWDIDGSDRHADVFHLKIVFHAVMAAFTAKTGLFDAAERAQLG